jgi:hypothetical protein
MNWCKTHSHRTTGIIGTTETENSYFCGSEMAETRAVIELSQLFHLSHLSQLSRFTGEY